MLCNPQRVCGVGVHKCVFPPTSHCRNSVSLPATENARKPPLSAEGHSATGCDLRASQAPLGKTVMKQVRRANGIFYFFF